MEACVMFRFRRLPLSVGGFACRCLCQNVVQGAGRTCIALLEATFVDEFKQAVKSLVGSREMKMIGA